MFLVDADLRMQNINEAMGYDSPKGLVEHLLDGCPPGDREAPRFSLNFVGRVSDHYLRVGNPRRFV